MPVAKRRHRDMRRCVVVDFVAQHIDRRCRRAQFFGQPEIGPAEKTRGIGATPSCASAGDGLAAPAPAPTFALGGADVPAPLAPALRPRIVIAIGRENDAHLRASRDGELDQLASRERLVIRMRREHQQAIGCLECQFSRHRSVGRETILRSPARACSAGAQTTASLLSADATNTWCPRRKAPRAAVRRAIERTRGARWA